MELDYAIRLCKSIGECEVGTIKKQAINTVIDELLKYCDKSITMLDKSKNN